MLKGTMEGGTDNSAIDAFQGGRMVNTGNDKNMHTAIFAEKNNLHNQFQVSMEGMCEIESLVTHNMVFIQFALADVNNVKGKIFDRPTKSQA